jgi:hypothetical protein
MVPVLKFLEFLRIIRIARRIARNSIKRFPGRGASLLTFLGRTLNTWCRFWLGNFGRPKPAERRFLGTEASSFSVSGGSAVREYVVAPSHVPASVSHPSLHEQPAAVVGVDPPAPASISVGHPHAPNPSHPIEGRSLGNRSTGNLSAVSIQSSSSDRYSIITNSLKSISAPLGQPSRDRRASGISIQSNASDRYSIIANSRESIRAPLDRLDQPSRRATYPLVGRGSDPARDPARSRERPTRPSTPATRPHTPIHSTHPPRLEIITALPSTHGDGDGNVNPVVQPSASSSYTHEPLSAPPMSEIRRRQSSTIVVDIQNPSTESLPISFSTNPPQITDEPLAMDSFDSPTSSNDTLDNFVPEGRFVQLINSDQIPRYDKNVTMQVSYTILPLHPYIYLQIPGGDNL